MQHPVRQRRRRQHFAIAFYLCILLVGGCSGGRGADAGTLRASFVERFDRPNTTFGLGDDWDLRGRKAGKLPLPPATDGFIKDGHFTYAGDSIVYAARQFRSTVRSVGTIGSWERIRPASTTETAVGMVISANGNLISDMVHLAVTRLNWALTVRRQEGPFEPVANGRFVPPLELNRNYEFEMDATESSVTVRLPGQEIITDVSTDGLLGDRAFWQEFAKPETFPAGVVFDFDTVWAVEDGQPLQPVIDGKLAH